MWTLYIVLQKKEQFVQEKEAKRMEKELTKHARAIENKNKEELRIKGLMRNKLGWQQTLLKSWQLKRRLEDCPKSNGL